MSMQIECAGAASCSSHVCRNLAQLEPWKGPATADGTSKLANDHP